MKYLTLCALAWMGLSSVAHGEEELRVRSVETQFSQQSLTIEKSSTGDQVKGGLSAKTIADAHLQKQAAPSISKKRLESREENPDFWIYDAWLTFHADDDYDGYFSHFTVEFDADTAYVQTDVYARLYLSRGDVFEEYHTTSIFTIHADSADDSFLVESELLTGFPPGEYELLIELYDAYDDSLVAVFDGYNDADLSLISLESKNYEVEEHVVVVHESGGSFGYLMLLLVPLFLRRTMR